jgi:hypothetical protein
VNNKEAGLDLQMMCRRGCQPGNNDLLPLLPLPIEVLNAAIHEPSTRARGICKDIVSRAYLSGVNRGQEELTKNLR